MDLEKSFRHHILGVVNISKHWVCHGKNEASMPFYQTSHGVVASGGLLLFRQTVLLERDLKRGLDYS